MKAGDYESAVIEFEEYLEGETKIHWTLIEMVNGEDSCCTYDNVLSAKQDCIRMMK